MCGTLIGKIIFSNLTDVFQEDQFPLIELLEFQSHLPTLIGMIAIDTGKCMIRNIDEPVLENGSPVLGDYLAPGASP